MTTETKATINKGASKIANTIAKVYDAVKKQGSIVTQCVTSVATVYKGELVPKADEQFIADNVARIQKWSGKSEGPRKSEVRKIVRNYLTLPEALKLFIKRNNGATWHDAMKLATQLNKGFTPRQAVTALMTTAEAKKPNALDVFHSAITRITNIETRSTKVIAFRKDLTVLLAKHNLS